MGSEIRAQKYGLKTEAQRHGQWRTHPVEVPGAHVRFDQLCGLVNLFLRDDHAGEIAFDKVLEAEEADVLELAATRLEVLRRVSGRASERAQGSHVTLARCAEQQPQSCEEWRHQGAAQGGGAGCAWMASAIGAWVGGAYRVDVLRLRRVLAVVRHLRIGGGHVTPSSVIVPAGSGERGRRLLCALHADTLRTLYESVARTMLSKTVPMMLRRREVRNDGGLFLFQPTFLAPRCGRA